MWCRLAAAAFGRRRNVISEKSNEDGDCRENDNKAIGLDWQNNNFARQHAFLYIALASLHDGNVKVPKFTFCRGINTRQQLSFSFPEL